MNTVPQMNMVTQLVNERQEAANAASLAFKEVIEEGRDMDSGKRYERMMAYGRNLVEVQRLTQVLQLLGAGVKDAHQAYG